MAGELHDVRPPHAEDLRRFAHCGGISTVFSAIFSAGTGYDQVTGWGSYNAAGLATALKG